MNWVRTGLAALAVGLVAAPAAAAIDTVYVFGDSFVDSGNANLGTGGLAANAAQGYFQGRFGDGYNFADVISKRLTGKYADPFLANPAANTNYAVGGARAAIDRIIFPFPDAIPSLPHQLDLYGAQQGGPFVDTNGLYILSFGNNDVGAIQSGDTGGLSVSDYEDLYVANLVNTISFLNAGGADTIMLFGVPNPNEVEGLSLALKLNTAIAALQPTLTNSNFIQFDFFDFFARVQDHPTAYGLTADTSFDLTDSCIDPATYFGGPKDCTGYFSFDGIHVTKPIQFEIAREALAQAGLGAVPEPATWLLMIGGFGLVGTAMRRRAQTQGNYATAA